MADIALHPSFPADELEKIRKQELSGLAQNNEDANAIANNVGNSAALAHKFIYAEHHANANSKFRPHSCQCASQHNKARACDAACAF